jgi:5-methylcytosine-specific restriction protein A
MFNLSQRLWGEAKFPLIVLLNGKLTDYPWDRFRSAFGFSPDWRLAGMTYRLTPPRISRSPFPTEQDVIAAVVGTTDAAAGDKIFTDLLDQVELLYDSLEGRKKLREHIVRERDPALVRAFKSRLSVFACSICNFDFKQVYGSIGTGFIEAHHVKPIGLRDDAASTSINDLIPVCSNCHRMIHRKWPPYLTEDIAMLMSEAFATKSSRGF